MPIIVNLDVMMAKRKISLSELAEKQQSKSGAVFHPGSPVQSAGLPAR